jgi:hypothetical protein
MRKHLIQSSPEAKEREAWAKRDGQPEAGIAHDMPSMDPPDPGAAAE